MLKPISVELINTYYVRACREKVLTCSSYDRDGIPLNAEEKHVDVDGSSSHFTSAADFLVRQFSGSEAPGHAVSWDSCRS